MDGFWFKSGLFKIEDGEDEETNPRCYGKQLAYWLKSKFTEQGYNEVEVIPEDWGWCVMCSRKPYNLWVGCGSMMNELDLETHPTIPDSNEIIWHCFVVAEVPFMKKLFGKVETEQGIQKLTSEIEVFLNNEQQIELVPEP